MYSFSCLALIILICVCLFITYYYYYSQAKESMTSEPFSASASVSASTPVPTVWIYAYHPVRNHNKNMSRFSDIFCGFQRLALASTCVHLEKTNPIRFIHKNNIRKLCPRIPCDFHKIDPFLLEHYCKYQMLSKYGGFWISPNTLVFKNINTIFQAELQKYRNKSKNSLSTAPYMPFAMISGTQLESSAYENLLIPDDACILCEPNNPIITHIASVLEKYISEFPNHPDYSFNQDASKMLYYFIQPSVSMRDSESVYLANTGLHGLTDPKGNHLTMEMCMSEYTVCRPSDHIAWFSFDSYYKDRIFVTQKYGWFTNLSEDQIVDSKMWISRLYREALQFEKGSSTVLVYGQTNPAQVIWENQL